MLREIDGLRVLEPDGAFYCFPDVRGLLNRPLRGRTASTSLELGAILLDEAKIAVVPGEGFGAPGYIRLSYALADDELQEGLARFQQVVAKYSLTAIEQPQPSAVGVHCRFGLFPDRRRSIDDIEVIGVLIFEICDRLVLGRKMSDISATHTDGNGIVEDTVCDDLTTVIRLRQGRCVGVSIGHLSGAPAKKLGNSTPTKVLLIRGVEIENTCERNHHVDGLRQTGGGTQCQLATRECPTTATVFGS